MISGNFKLIDFLFLSKIILSVFCYLVVLIPVPVYADSSLELSDVIESVLENFPLVLAAEQDIIDAEGRKRSALGAFDIRWKNKATVAPLGFYETQRFESVIEKPTSIWGTNFFAGYRRSNGNFPVYRGSEITSEGGEFRAGMQVPLVRNRRIDERRAGLNKAEIAIDTADQSVLLQKINIVREATIAYWKWVAAGRKVTIVMHLLERAKDRDEGIKERVLQGDLPEFERKDNQRNVLERETQLIRAERSYQEAAIGLSLFYRDDFGEPKLPEKIILPKVIPPPTLLSEYAFNELFQKALVSRPEVKALKNELEQNSIDLQLAKNDVNPRIDFLVEMSKDIGEVDRTRDQAELESGLLLEIPIQRREAQGRIKSADAINVQLEKRIQFIKDKIANEVQDALSAIRNARDQIDVVKKELQFAKELEEGERVRFREGESTILIVNLREQATADSAIRKVGSLLEYHKAEAMLKAALGEIN